VNRAFLDRRGGDVVIDARSYQASETLKDGTPVSVRAIRHDDWSAVLAAFNELDPEAVYTRFFAYKKTLTDDDLRRTTDVDFDRVVALVVTMGQGNAARLLGGGRYAINDERHPPESAEVAFITSDACRGRGVAPLLLAHLVRIARERKLLRFEAIVLPMNQPMLSVFRGSGLPMTAAVDGDVVTVTLSL
jgi:GNAT superfamily N-acetyltransferase